jgi:hypothetical protein
MFDPSGLAIILTTAAWSLLLKMTERVRVASDGHNDPERIIEVGAAITVSLIYT